jgi:hypothetical protein
VNAATPGQAAYEAFRRWYADEGKTRTMMQGFDESKYDAMRRAFLAGTEAEAAIAAAAPAPQAARADEFARVKVKLCALIDRLDKAAEREYPTDLAQGNAYAQGAIAGQLRAILDETALHAAAPAVPQPAPGADLDAYEADIASLTDQRNRVSETAEHLRELLDEIGVMAANAPEDGDSFGVLEEIAMRIGAADMPDPAPEAAAAPELAAAAPDSEQRAVIDQIWRMCQNPRQTAGTSQGVVVNGERLADRIAGLIKNSGMEPF